ncbi:transporter substrate-binding domain-containing protein [Paucilactobacillus nenjiangensis]|uniref:transporter substrate-binding domain-containing protein n=1 Tax=Paucilactobacillus nenjiangensis TaxID=1296540 RepID=UPI0028D21290|nr:transporter substrate-binding domain-containing protein [Paucilactobacillus nenjiangensis]
MKKIQDKGTLVVGTEAEFAPFEFPIIKNGQKVITGYDMYIAKAIADDMGVKLKIVNTTFSSLIPDLKENKIDLVLAGMTATPERRKSVAFSNGYYKVENGLLVQKGMQINMPKLAILIRHRLVYNNLHYNKQLRKVN